MTDGHLPDIVRQDRRRQPDGGDRVLHATSSQHAASGKHAAGLAAAARLLAYYLLPVLLLGCPLVLWYGNL